MMGGGMTLSCSMMILELELQMKSGFACSAFENEPADQRA